MIRRRQLAALAAALLLGLAAAPRAAWAHDARPIYLELKEVLLLARAFELLTVSLKRRWPRTAELVPAYVVGSLGALWSFQRIAVMIHGG